MSTRERYKDESGRTRLLAPAYEEKNGASGVTTPSEFELVHRPLPQTAPYLYAQSGPVSVKQRQARSWYKRPKALLWFLTLLVVIVLGVVLGLYYGLRSRTRDNGDLKLPSMGLASDQGGMEAVGSFLTSSDQSGSQQSQVFSWSDGGLVLSAMGAGTKGVDLLINISSVQQPMDGFGSSLTDSSCYLLHTLKLKNETQYNQTMDYFFNARTGMSTMRVPIGSSDYSNQGEYTYAEVNATAAALSAGNTTSLPSALRDFSIQTAEAYIMPVLQDAVARKSDLKVWLSPWSPPPWMKTSNSINGGQLIYGIESLYAQYLFRTVQSYTAQGVRPYAVTMQNEPAHGSDSYPTNWMSAQTSALIAGYLRANLDEEGYTDVKLFANDDNFANWTSATEAIQANSSAWAGVAWHGYDGNYTTIDDFNATVTNITTPIEQHLTEITTTDDSRNQWWSTRYWLRNYFFGPINMGVRSVMSWNVVLDKNDRPYISTAPCKNCLGTFQIDSPSASLSPPVIASNAQFITVYHFSSATSNLTAFGGGVSYRVDAALTSTVSSKIESCMTAMSAFSAPWNGTSLAQSDMKRVGLVLVNDCQSSISVNIGVEDRQGSFTFQPGLTTLVFNV